MLKVVIPLIIIGLVAQSSGFAVKRLQKAATTTPGFNFISEENDNHEKLSVSAPGGEISLPRTYLKNVTAWTINPTIEGSTSISQNVNFLKLGVDFNHIQVSVGDDLYVAGLSIHANLTEADYNLTLIARGDGSACTLETKISPLKGDVDLWMFDLYYVDDAFLSDEVNDEMEAVVWKAVGEAVTGLLTEYFEEDLDDKQDEDDLCELILAGNVDEVPKIKF